MTGRTIDANVYLKPKPELVATIIADKGIDAAMERWHWMSSRDLTKLSLIGRARITGQNPILVKRQFKISDMDRAVAVEAAFALASTSRGERAACLHQNGGRACFEERGLDYVRASYSERARNTTIGIAANRGDQGAINKREANLAFELAVGRVLRAALALVPEQPPIGRYRLPPLGPELAEALKGERHDAVALVFPDLVMPATPIEEATPMLAHINGGTTHSGSSRTFNRAPSVERIVADHATGRSLRELAAEYGITIMALRYHWLKLGLPTGPKARRAVTAQGVSESIVLPEAALIAAELPEIQDRGAPPVGDRLSLSDLQLAVELAARTGIDQAAAIAWVRADRDAGRIA